MCQERRAYVGIVADPGGDGLPASALRGHVVTDVKRISASVTVSWKMITGSARSVPMISGSSKLPRGGI